MSSQFLDVQSLHDIRTYVHFTLCEQNELASGSFEVTEQILVRRKKMCGILFCMHGPRSVRLTAIWETERNTILFYGSSGTRTATAKLPMALRIKPAV